MENVVQRYMSMIPSPKPKPTPEMDYVTLSDLRAARAIADSIHGTMLAPKNVDATKTSCLFFGNRGSGKTTLLCKIIGECVGKYKDIYFCSPSITSSCRQRVIDSILTSIGIKAFPSIDGLHEQTIFPVVPRDNYLHLLLYGDKDKRELLTTVHIMPLTNRMVQFSYRNSGVPIMVVLDDVFDMMTPEVFPPVDVPMHIVAATYEMSNSVRAGSMLVALPKVEKCSIREVVGYEEVRQIIRRLEPLPF